MKIDVVNGILSKKEIDEYVNQIVENNTDKYINSVKLTLDGDFVNVEYTYEAVPFERIRRITGYLVGTVDRFNNAKRAEVEDRVKHSLGCECSSMEEIA